MAIEIKARASLSKPITANAELGRIKEIIAESEKYDGSYTVDIDSYHITIPTEGKLMERNLDVYQGDRFDGNGGIGVVIDPEDPYEWVVDGGTDEYDPDTDENYRVYMDDFMITARNVWFDKDLHVVFHWTEYQGPTSYTVTNSNITIPTKGKHLDSNITVDISALETLAEEISEVVG